MSSNNDFNRTDKVLIALTIIICLWGLFTLVGCKAETSSPRVNKSDAQISQTDAEQRLREAVVLVTR